MGGREDWGRTEDELMRARGVVDEVLVCMGLAPAHYDENLRARVSMHWQQPCMQIERVSSLAVVLDIQEWLTLLIGQWTRACWQLCSKASRTCRAFLSCSA
jgi:hypothetical protein